MNVTWRVAICLAAGLAMPPILAHGGGIPVVRSTAESQKALAVTVYTVGRGMITDTRRIELPAGTVEVEFRNVAQSIIPETVGVDPGAGATVLEQNYEYDLLSPQTLLAKYVGREIELEFEEPGKAPGEKVLRREPATLLSVNNGTVWRMEGRIVLNPPYRRLFFPRIPESLRDRPTLVWRIKNAEAGPHTVQASYLANNMNWHADYVLALGEDGTEGRFSGWITLDNKSGATYRNASLRLIAGNLHTVAPEVRGPRLYKARMAGESVQQESFSEYHLYTVPRPVTIKERQTKQIGLFGVDGVRVERSYRVGLGTIRFQSSQQNSAKVPVQTYLSFENASANHLGMPLPKGVVRVYRRHSDGSNQFVGEDRIDHTPKDESVSLELGTAFDLVAEARQTDFRRLATNLSESAWEVKLRNHKERAVTIDVFARLSSDWELLAHSHPWKKMNVARVRFRVEVPANGQQILTWRVRTRW